MIGCRWLIFLDRFTRRWYNIFSSIKNWSIFKSISLASLSSSGKILLSKYLIIGPKSGQILCAFTNISGSIIIASVIVKSGPKIGLKVGSGVVVVVGVAFSIRLIAVS